MGTVFVVLDSVNIAYLYEDNIDTIYFQIIIMKILDLKSD